MRQRKFGGEDLSVLLEMGTGGEEAEAEDAAAELKVRLGDWIWKSKVRGEELHCS